MGHLLATARGRAQLRSLSKSDRARATVVDPILGMHLRPLRLHVRTRMMRELRPPSVQQSIRVASLGGEAERRVVELIKSMQLLPSALLRTL